MSEVVVKVRKLSEKAAIPSYAYQGDAAFDLCTAETVTLPPGGRAAVPSGLSFEIPEGYVGLIWDKSGVAIKKGIKTLGGVIDCGYRGEVLVGMVNLSGEPFTFSVGDKVAQMIIQKKESVRLVEAEALGEAERGERGFGSSGI